MFENRTPKSYDHLLQLSDTARAEAEKYLLGFLRTLPEEQGQFLYREQARDMGGISTKIGISYKGKGDFKRTLPKGLIGIRRTYEPGKVTDEFQVLTQPLAVIVVDVDYDSAEAILDDGSRFTFPPLLVASDDETKEAQVEIDEILADLFSRIHIFPVALPRVH